MRKYYIIFILLLLYACVEHKFFFHVTPNGRYEVQYSAHGDKMDLQDHDFPLPEGVAWNIHSTMEQIDAESYDYTAQRFFKRNDFIECFGNDAAEQVRRSKATLDPDFLLNRGNVIAL